jgi:hypothetical protein
MGEGQRAELAEERAEVAAGVTRRRTEAQRLRSSAGEDRAAAKARFEQELLGVA